MTEHPANDKSISEKAIDSPLTVRDLLVVLESLFGKDISDRAVGLASNKGIAGVSAPDIPGNAATKASTTVSTTASTGDTTELQVSPAPLTGDVENPVNPARVGAIRWYAVTVGKDVGVFSSWNVVAPLVVHVSGACYPRYASRQAAEEAYRLALETGTVRRVV